MYQLQTRLLDILNLPLAEKIQQLKFCIETGPIKDLQAFFPALVQNIFGINPSNNVGWGLRTITPESSEYYMLYNFFNPHETFFRLIYRLHTAKFEFAFPDLPRSLKSMLEGARIDGFYTKLISTDHFQPKMLSLNAFDFFILHFVAHGTKNLHKISAAAMTVNNENTMTVYFNLVADYLCNFLPNDPNSVVYPQIDISPVKSTNPAPMISSSMAPMRQPRYLLLSSLSHQIPSPTNQRDVRLEGSRSSSANWRSETVLMFFIDCWLRYDMDETYELPSNEFIRLLRILVKQLHYFGNCAEQDTSSLSILRQQSQNLLNARMYSFLKTIMARWPLDTSFINVIELWLSYIQPWRYLYNRNLNNLNNDIIDIPDRFRTFINENLLSFTQIFVRLIPRFLKMDLGLNKNAHMLFRILKVFRQPSDILKDYERILINSNSIHRSQHSSYINESSNTARSPNNSMNRSGDKFSSLHRHASQLFDDSNYLCMFSDEVTMQIYELMQRVYSAKMKTNFEIGNMEKLMQQNITLWERFLKFIGWLSSLNFSFSRTLDEKKKTPVYLDLILNMLSPMYSIPIEEATKEYTANATIFEDSDNEQSNTSFMNITPSYMKSQLSQINYTGDPELLPIMSSEVRPLVRLFYPITSKLNEMFGNEIYAIWNREDFYGKVGRQILSPPVETRVFDKSAGYAELQIRQIGPRLSLRKFANKTILAIFVASFIIGHFFFGASSLGFITFIFVSLIYLIVKAMFS
jgi:sphingomyelin phosphodiesterase 4